MIPEADYLILEICCGKAFPGLACNAAVAAGFRKTAIVFPFPLAAEADNCKEAKFVAKVVDVVVLTPDILEADAVEAHVADHQGLGTEVFVGVLHEQVVRPAGALDENLLAVEDIAAILAVNQLRSDVPEAKADGLGVGDLLANGKAGVQMVKLRRAHFCAPPDAGVLNNLRVGNHHGLSGGNVNGDIEASALVRCLQRALHGLGAAVHKGGFHQEGGVRKILHVDQGLYKQVLNLDVRSGDEGDGTKDAHALVHRAGVPIYIAVVQGLFGSLVNLHHKGVVSLDLTGDIVFPYDEGADGFFRTCQELAVQINIGAVAKAVETEHVAAAGLCLELGGINPGRVKLGFVDILVILALIDVFSKQAGLVERSCNGAGNGDLNAGVGAFAGERPVGELLCARVRACKHEQNCGNNS